MEYIQIAGTDMKTSRIGLGTWAIGGFMWGGTDEDAAIKTIHTAIDKGINVIDTAADYGLVRSEEINGKALKQTGTGIRFWSRRNLGFILGSSL
jgi:aryl-alcohol dehydrogenase-like predicted oxidoreductase